ncbi:hypothetical protein AMS68_004373 [Peltaster fructicola]|uniref:BZIP domain-containing protein n=1 Tax=Peltaster fructicola TaxID=286661 RepID=A0A6H0XVZ7_9PEZI|nr:hypothetical protein AMS68_004373 [Peltaster fructicola]
MNAEQGSRSEDTLSGGFERLWKRAGKRSAAASAEPGTQAGGQKERSGFSRLFSAKSRSTDEEASGGSGGSDGTEKPRRRQQIYNAQKRHREKKSIYIKGLETEIYQLRNMESAVTTQKERLLQQNARLRSLLEDHQNAGMSTSFDQQLPFATVSVHHDAEMQHERLFLEPHAHSTAHDDSWAAMDFILALEWPCRSHIPHPVLSPPGVPFQPCGDAAFNGHGLTMTSAILGSSLHHQCMSASELPSYNGIDDNILQKWQLPYAEIEKLVCLAERLELDDDFITPAQAYSAIKAQCPQPVLLRRVLATMKSALTALVQCQGFGAVMDTTKFNQCLAHALAQNL